MYKDGTCPSTTAADGSIVQGACPDAYGKVLGLSISSLCPPLSRLMFICLGTSLICSFLEIGMSFCSPRLLKRLFPPLVTGKFVFNKAASAQNVTGTVILLIGASLIGSSGIPNWGGGSNDCQNRPNSGIFELCPTIFAPRPLP